LFTGLVEFHDVMQPAGFLHLANNYCRYLL